MILFDFHWEHGIPKKKDIDVEQMEDVLNSKFGTVNSIKPVRNTLEIKKTVSLLLFRQLGYRGYLIQLLWTI